MEFKLNKIDTDIRRKLQEEIKENKVHSTKSTDVKRDIVKEKNENYDNKNKKKKYISNNDKRFITIDGIKYNDKSIEIKAEKFEEINEKNTKGTILDAKK